MSDQDQPSGAQQALEDLVPVIAVMVNTGISITDMRAALLHLAASAAINERVSRAHFCAEAGTLYDNMLAQLPNALAPAN